MKKSTLILTLLLLLSCKAPQKPNGTINYQEPFEVMNGKVKQVKEMFIDVTSDKPETIVTDFDMRGNATQTHERVIQGDNNTTIYKYKYDNAGIRTEVATMSVELGNETYQCDKYGRIAGKSTLTDMVSRLNKTLQEKSFYKYDAEGNMIEADLYLESELRFSEKYKYNDHHLLLEVDAFSLGDNFADTMSYKCLAFDKHGNWTKRARLIKDNDPFIVTRYLTYY